MPRASLRSVLTTIDDNAARICRVSISVTDAPRSARPLAIHSDKGPASRPTRASGPTASWRTSSAAIASGSDPAVTSAATEPSTSMMQIAVFSSDTSRATKVLMAVLLG